MRILHTADWHLGIDFHKLSLIEDQRWFMQQLKKIVLEENVDVIIVAGDVYDTYLASKEAIILYDEIMQMLCIELKKKVIVIAGNHDSATRLSVLSGLLSGMGLYVVGSLTEKVKGIEIEDCIFYPIPYFHLEQVRKAYEVNVQTQEEAFACICEDIVKQTNGSKHRIAIAHSFFANASVCDSDRFANVGGSELVSSKVFDGFSYVAMGHLHRRQYVGNHVWYSGSPLPYSFSEANMKKGVLIYDSETDNVYEKNIEPLHPLIVKKGKYEELKENMMIESVDENAYMKIEVEDFPVSFEMMEYFRQNYPNLLHLSGKMLHQEDSNITIDIKDLEMLSDIDLVIQFFKDYYNEELSDTALSLFKEVQEEVIV